MSSYFVYAILMATCPVFAFSASHPGPDECVPVAVNKSLTIDWVATTNGYAGLCTNKEGTEGFKLCKGYCKSGHEYVDETGKFEPYCNCCRVSEYEPIPVELTCDDNSNTTVERASHAKCTCRSCEDGEYPTVPQYKQSTKAPTGKEY